MARDHTKCEAIAKAAAEAAGWKHNGIRYSHADGTTVPAKELHIGAEWMDLCDVETIDFGGCPDCCEDDLCRGIG
jgi:hypothetical protein